MTELGGWFGLATDLDARLLSFAEIIKATFGRNELGERTGKFFLTYINVLVNTFAPMRSERERLPLGT